MQRLIVVYIIVVGTLFGIVITRTGIQRNPTTEFRPMRKAENIPVGHFPVNGEIGSASAEVLVFSWRQLEHRFKPSFFGFLSVGREIARRVRKDYASTKLPWRAVAGTQMWTLYSFYDFHEDIGLYNSSDSFSAICKAHWYNQRLVFSHMDNLSDNLAFSVLDGRPVHCESQPSALILPHLTLDGINLGLHFPELLASVTISRPRLRFGFIESGLHDAELTVKNYESNNTYSQSNDGENNSYSSPKKSFSFKLAQRIVFNKPHKYFFGFITLIFGLFTSRLTCDFFLGTSANNWWGRWVNRLDFANWSRVYLAVLFLLSSVGFICHGIITLFMPRLALW